MFAYVNVLKREDCAVFRTAADSEMDDTRRRSAERRSKNQTDPCGTDLEKVADKDATMNEAPPKHLRVRSLGTRLSEAEYAQCEKSAARRGLTIGEWCRQVLLAASEKEAEAGPAETPEAEVILAEILALRKIVINLLYGYKAGQPLDEERMSQLIVAADSDKLAKAAARLRPTQRLRTGGLGNRELPVSRCVEEPAEFKNPEGDV
jgi:hypothetical protein